MPSDELRFAHADSLPKRQYLEELLAECQQARVPGDQLLVTTIEQALAELPSSDEAEPTPPVEAVPSAPPTGGA